ncbi:MAG: hypothetical protein KJ069_31770 [Anaerolineae bacterium]|nr:hypothetical protein [Anaerolineae bacterium]
MAVISKQVRAYLQSLIEAFKIENNQKPINPEVLVFVQWLLPIAEEREDEYRQAFKAILGDDPLWIPCMQCEHDGIFFNQVSEPRPRLSVNLVMPLVLWYRELEGEKILIGTCQKCGITEHLHLLVVVHALEKRKKVTGELAIPEYILAEADF